MLTDEVTCYYFLSFLGFVENNTNTEQQQPLNEVMWWHELCSLPCLGSLFIEKGQGKGNVAVGLTYLKYSYYKDTQEQIYPQVHLVSLPQWSAPLTHSGTEWRVTYRRNDEIKQLRVHPTDNEVNHEHRGRGGWRKVIFTAQTVKKWRSCSPWMDITEPQQTTHWHRERKLGQRQCSRVRGVHNCQGGRSWEEDISE